ncbi:hypothetical protein ACO0QE_000810 [Hanseniaspora vineae]
MNDSQHNHQKKAESYEEDFNIDDESELRHTGASHAGIYFLLASQLFSSVPVILTKLLVADPLFQDDPLKPFEILFPTMFLTLGCTLLYVYVKRKSIPYAPFGLSEVRKWLVARGSFGFFGVFGLYASLKALSVSDAIVITFLTPAVTGILATIFLKEQFSKVEGICGAVALFGVILVVRPTFLFRHTGNEISDSQDLAESSSPRERLVATIFGLIGVLGGSSIYIIIKHIGSRAHALINVTYYAFFTCFISLSGILVSSDTRLRLPTTLNHWLIYVVIGLSNFGSQVTFTVGIQKEKKTSRSALVIYSQIIYALIWDVLIFHHVPSIWSWCGIIIIISSTVYALFYKNTHTQNSDLSFSDTDVESSLPTSENSPDNDILEFELDDIRQP